MTRAKVLSAVAVCLSLLCNEVAAERGSKTTDFVVFDALLFQSKPDLSRFGIKPLHVIYESDLWTNGDNRNEFPRIDRLSAAVTRAAARTDIVVIDIEHWPYRKSMGNVDDGLRKYEVLLGQCKNFQPSARFGIYSLPPVRDYWQAIKSPESAEYKAWQAENDRLSDLVSATDVLFPSLYTFYTDRAGWVKVAEATLKEARRVGQGKPIYAFIYPQYHESNKSLGGTPVDGQYWRLQLETLRKHADGVVIWGGWQTQWDENAAWWIETKAFLKELQKGEDRRRRMGTAETGATGRANSVGHASREAINER